MTVVNVPPNDFKAPPNKGRKKCGGRMICANEEVLGNLKRCEECGAIKYTTNAHCEAYIVKAKK